MNPAYVHLVWKEYRAIRAFWLALVILSVGLQWAAPQVVDDARLIVLNVALATPVFFAVGCIGTAFALEKEEGTYDWLRASPASDGQVFLAKMSLCLFGTAAMYAVLWPVALWIIGGRMPEPGVWHGMLALWPLAAVEAIAWGAFFSLRFERPLPAIILALVVTSTIVHLAAMPHANGDFSFGRYLSAVPLRLAVIAPVLAYDVYLGLRWLQRENLRPTAGRAKIAAAPRQVVTPIAQKQAVTGHLRRRDRGMLLGHLLWQQWRQSWRLMLLMVALQFATMSLIGYSMIGSDIDQILPALPLIGFAALMGSSVFRPDQEGRSYRFFVEHNVPPRYVWLTRVLPWLVVAILSGAFVAIYWLGSHRLLLLLTGSIDPGQRRPPHYEVIVFVGLGAATLAFAGGQWISMMVRSSLLASFFTLLLAAALTLWMFGCFFLRLSFLYFLVPIPLVFYLATWLRVPDWISENTTWRARTKAAAAVMVPALVLFTAAPIARVNQLPKIDPGFSVAAYLAEITPEELAAGELYKQANEALHDRDRRGQRALGLILKASAAPDVVVADPATLVDWHVIENNSLISLVNHSADRLANDGKLAEARDRYLLAFKVVSDLTNHAPQLNDWYSQPQYSIDETFHSLNEWGAYPMQSEASIREAISRLQAISVDVLHSEDAIKSNYVLCRRYIEGDERLAATLLGAKNPVIFQRALVARLLPWEAFRELRALNVVSAFALTETRSLRASLLARGSVDDVEKLTHQIENAHLYATYYSAARRATPLELSPLLVDWNSTSRRQMINFETTRRSTLIILAIQAYQLKHGALPNSLEDLVSKSARPGDGYFASLPIDPYTGRNYIYFRDGLPEPTSPQDQVDLKTRYNHWPSKLNRNIRPGVPCLWSAGPHLQTFATKGHAPNEGSGEIELTPDQSALEDRYGFVYQPVDNAMRKRPDYEAWARGEWFPIPLGQPAGVRNAEPKPIEKDDKPSEAIQGVFSDVNELIKALNESKPGDVQP